MNPEQIVHDIVQRHNDAVAAAAETQMTAIIAGAARIVRSLLDEGRLITCGSGASAANAQHLAVKLLGRLDRDRPGLPALCLSDSGAVLSAINAQNGSGDLFARQLRALGRSGDVLVVFSATGNSSAAVQAVISAHDRDMAVIAFTGQDGGDLARVLRPDDIEIRVPVSSPVRIEEVHLLLANLVCDLLERELFGDNP